MNQNLNRTNFFKLIVHGAKSRKYQEVFEVKSRVKTWQVRGIWSQQLASPKLGDGTRCPNEAKEKYRGMFEIQKSGDKTSSGEIPLDIRTHASPKVGQDQVSGGVSVLCWHAAPVAYVLWKPCTIR